MALLAGSFDPTSPSESDKSCMKIIHRTLYQQTSLAIGWALLGFVLVFSFFNVLDEVSKLGRPSLLVEGQFFSVFTMAQLVVLEIPFLAYDLIPICVLIGAVYAMSRFAVQSEFTVMRSGGLSPLVAIRLMSTLGLCFAAITFLTGDYLSPWADSKRTMIKAQFDGGISAGLTGGWLKEQRTDQKYSTLNVGELLPNGDIARVRIFEFDGQGRLLQRMDAQSARLIGGELHLKDVKRTVYPRSNDGKDIDPIKTDQLTSLEWPTSLQPEMITATLLKKQKMNTFDLYRVIQHLQSNEQNSQRQQIDFWSKLIYPLSCVVMALMALPFAYLHFRQSGVSLYVFIGIMLGISFFLLSNMFAYIGNLQGWRPWLAAASPSLIYVTLSMAAVTWRVLRR